MQLIAPPGSVVNVRHPGPSVGGNTDLQPKLIDLLLAALRQAVPERVAAASGGSSSNLLFGGVHPETGRYYTNYHFDGMGAGGTALKDGNDGEITRHSNCRNTPVEVFEHRYPLLTLELPAGAGFRRRRASIAAASAPSAPCGSRAERSPSARSSTAASSPAGASSAGCPACGSALLVSRRARASSGRFDEVFGVASPTKFTNVVLRRGRRAALPHAGRGGLRRPRASAIRRCVREDVLRGLRQPRRRPRATTGRGSTTAGSPA